MRLASMSVDLDSVRHYFRIHGLAEPAAGGAADPVYRLGAGRFGELCARLGFRGTAFAVGEDLGHPEAAAAVRALAGAGHEIGNHTFSHDYALTRRPDAEIAGEVRRGGEAIAAAVGGAPAGFRAPGYTLSGSLLGALVAARYRYDSSAFPAAPYWLAKAAVLAWLRLA